VGLARLPYWRPEGRSHIRTTIVRSVIDDYDLERFVVLVKDALQGLRDEGLRVK
jgi:hypothetical protein